MPVTGTVEIAWRPCRHDQHQWQPILKWAGRYKCEICHAIGYRGVVTASEKVDGSVSAFKKISAIIEYKCPGCKGPTTSWSTKKRLANKNYCPTCRNSREEQGLSVG